MMILTRRGFIKIGIFVPSLSLMLHFFSICWAKVKRILPRGFSREALKGMNPEEVDNRDLEIDPIERFGTMGTSDMSIDITRYRLKISGKVKRPLSLSYDQIMKFPQMTETVLLICPGFFAYNAQWTGTGLKGFIQEAQPEKGVKHIDIKGADGKTVRIPFTKMDQKKIFLAYRVNGENLPKKHGFPLRLVYEDAYGSEWIKYVEEMVFS